MSIIFNDVRSAGQPHITPKRNLTTRFDEREEKRGMRKKRQRRTLQSWFGQDEE